MPHGNIENSLKVVGETGATISLPGVKVMIATPSMDGRLDVRYFTSFYETAKTLAQVGAVFQWHCEIYNADIVAARSKIIREFLKSDNDWLLSIDADMGWEPNAIMRLFYAKKDFVAVGGRKKCDPFKPAEYAVNAVDRMGESKILSFDNVTGTSEVSEVGMAFCLVSRACITKMVEGYPDLLYANDEQGPIPALFMPLIRDNSGHEKPPRYFAEDFAFCRRWRDIGGKVYVCPDIALDHVGFYCWRGSLAESGKPANEAEAKEMMAAVAAE